MKIPLLLFDPRLFDGPEPSTRSAGEPRRVPHEARSRQEERGPRSHREVPEP